MLNERGLLPCPFCGSHELSTFKNSVVCGVCSASGPDLGHVDDVPGSIAAWNRRPAFTEPVTGEAEPVAEVNDLPGCNLISWKRPIPPVGTKLYASPVLPTTAEAEGMVWDVEEFRVWRGLDPDKPQWHGLGFAYATWTDAADLMAYLQHNAPERLLRVAPFATAPPAKSPPSQEPAE